MTADTLTEWIRPTQVRQAPERTVRLAFLGRTSDDELQDPTLSIPRQLNNSEHALLPGMVIVAHFYDVESSRKELNQRGKSTAWKRFDIGIPRDGGLADLLEEAASPDRRFDAVICESIDRIARWTHQGTKIEHDLELLGVPLLASDEPIILNGQTNGRKRKRASQVLLRRTKQGVAEWYILEMLEKSWDGFETHTTQGWNVGKPPYGYFGEKHKHPVPAKRAQGQHKTKLVIDPVRGPVVEQIYEWRITKRWSYNVIAGQLNANLDLYLPPQPVDPERAVGEWTASSVRDILTNPKYTGWMVWNRRSTKDKLHPGKVNPREQWVVSEHPTHPAIVSLEAFLAAQEVAAARVRSRSDAVASTPNRHRQTKRVYTLRSYVWCGPCERRMFGRKVTNYTYYSCQPRNRKIPDGHPRMLSVTEETLLDFTDKFFNSYVFGPDRVQLALRSADITASQDAEVHQQKITAAQRALEDITNRRRRLLLAIEQNDDPDGSIFQDIKVRRVELDQARESRLAELAQLEETAPARTGDPHLLTSLPEMKINIGLLPTDRLRNLLEAFAVEIRHDVTAQQVTIRASISNQSLPHLRQLAPTVAHRPRARGSHTKHTDAVPADDGGDGTTGGDADLQFCGVPRRGHDWDWAPVFADSANRCPSCFPPWGPSPRPHAGDTPEPHRAARLKVTRSVPVGSGRFRSVPVGSGRFASLPG